MAYRDKWQPRGAGYPQAKHGRLSDYRVAFTTVDFGTFSVRQYLPGDEADEEVRAFAVENQVGPTVQLAFNLHKMRRPVGLNLTNLTEQELDALRTIVNLAFDLAEPVVKDRDEVAREAARAGDDSYLRIYRAVPPLVVRPGKVLAYGEGILERLANVLARFGGGVPRLVDRWGTRVLGTGDGVADEASEDPGPEDDGAPTD